MLQADIFAFNVKPQAWDESLLTLPVEFMADVLIINMKRLPLRLANERADFDLNANKYHVGHPRDDRRSGILDGAAIGDDEEDDGRGGTSRLSSGKKKKKWRDGA